MKLRKLSPGEAAQLCGCGLTPDERGHAHSCAVWQSQEVARLRARIAALEVRIAGLVAPHATPTQRRHIRLIPEQSSAWRCVVCNQSAFARSVRDPERCIRCAALASRNGHMEATHV